MENTQIASIFATIADILDIKGDNPFRIRSYQNAARIIGDLSPSIAAMVKDGDDLKSLPGIGSGIQEKIVEIVTTGKCSFLEKLKSEIPEEVISMLHLEGLGPKKVGVLFNKLHIETFDELEKHAKDGSIADLDGFGDKTAEKILKSLERYKEGEGRFTINIGFQYAVSLVSYLSSIPGVKRVEPAGSLRRRRETVGDLDLLAICDDSTEIMNRFVSYDDVQDIIAHGPTKSSVRLSCGLQVDLRVLTEDEFGAALHYFTGSKAHNIAIRKRAIERGLKVSEYGVFDKSDKKIAGKTEEEVFKSVGLPLIPPELREDRGEIDAAEQGRLPDLIELSDIKGDLQMHTTATDGKNTVIEMAEKAKTLGYEYIAITNHSKAVRVAGGLDDKQLLEHFKEIDEANRKLENITVLKGVEVDIMPDGSLDLKDETLAQCDMVLAAVHFKFGMPEDEMTERIISGISNPYVNILGHPTGRLILQRDPYQVNIEKLIDTAVEHNVILEIDAYPDRLDLKDIHARLAKEKGAKLSIDTDAHAVQQLDMMKYGVFTARRGWIEKSNVVNTFPLKELMAVLKKT